MVSSKGSAGSAGDTGDIGSIPGWRRSLGGGNGNLLLILLPGKFHGQRSPVQPMGHKQVDMTEHAAQEYLTLNFIQIY